LKLVIEFCSKGPRALLTKPILTDVYVVEVREWELNFFEWLDFDKVQELLIASSFLNNEILTDACNAYVAYTLKQTSIEKLENTYDINTNLTIEQNNDLMDKYKHLVIKDLRLYVTIR
jgi:hypothetical protein